MWKSFVPWKKIFVFKFLILVLVFLFLVFVCHKAKLVKWNLFAHSGLHINRSIEINFKKPKNLNYGVVIDCGSSGSRVFVYCWELHSGCHDQLLDIHILKDSSNKPVIKKTEPGLSSYISNPLNASESLKPLLEFVLDHIPLNKVTLTPLYILATAGMRMLNENQKASIIKNLVVDISLNFDFNFNSNHVEIISGKWEGLFAWIGLNHATGKFDHKLNDDNLVAVDFKNKSHIRKKTLGMLDLGGASMQITFELPSFNYQNHLSKENLANLDLGCSARKLHYNLFSLTFLGHGSNHALSRYTSSLVEYHLNEYLNNMNNSKNKNNKTSKASFFSSSIQASFENQPKTNNGSIVINDPCFPPGYEETVFRHINNVEVEITMRGSGDLMKCMERQEKLLNKTGNCRAKEKNICSINDQLLPDIRYKYMNFYAFSEFFYSSEDILGIGGKYKYKTYLEKALIYCKTNWKEIEKWHSSNKFPRAQYNRYRTQCFKSGWLMTILHKGLNLPYYYKNLFSLQYLNGYELHWSLGAMLFKTSYYPLRAMKKDKDSNMWKTQVSYKSPNLPFHPSNFFFIFFFLSIFLFLIIIKLLFNLIMHHKKQKVTFSNEIHSIHLLNDCEVNSVDYGPASEKKKMVRSRSCNLFST